MPWVDQPLDREDELAEPLGVHMVRLQPEMTDSELAQAQRDDPALAPVIDWVEREVTPTTDDIRALQLTVLSHPVVAA